jgi:hypothetical protein
MVYDDTPITVRVGGLLSVTVHKESRSGACLCEL